MATYYDYIGNGGDYATLVEWKGASATNVSQGDVLYAILKDGIHDIGGGYYGWNEVDFDIIVSGENSHEGYFVSADRSSSAGATIVCNTNSGWAGFGDQTYSLTFANLVYSGLTSQTLYIGNSTVTSGYSGQYSAALTWDRCLFTHDPDYGPSIPAQWWSVYTGYESIDTTATSHTVSAVGTHTITVKNCVWENRSYVPWRFFPNTIPGVQSVNLVVNYIGLTSQHLTQSPNTNLGMNLAYVDATRDARDSTLTVNVSGSMYDDAIILRSTLVADWESATKTVNITDYLTNQSEATLKNNFGANAASPYVQPTFNFTNVNFVTTFSYSGSLVDGTVSFEETDQSSQRRNYRLVDGSLGIDYATNTTMPAIDVTGATRDATPTAGAFEFIASTTDVTINFGNTYIRVY